MEHSNIHVLGIAPYEGMKTAMERTAEEYPSIQLDVYTGDLEEGVAIVQSTQVNDYDCIISRGGTAELIRRVTDIPVVEIQLSVYDVLRAIKLAENYSNLYAIVGFPSITEPAHTLCDLLRYNLDILTVHSAGEVAETLERLKQGGYKMVVSDMVTHTVARKVGLDAFLITSGAESLHTAFDQALTLSAGFRRLRQENLFLRSISKVENGSTIVLDDSGALYYSTSDKPENALLSTLRTKMAEMTADAPLKFYNNDGGLLYTINAQLIQMGRAKYYLFHCQPSQIPLRSNKSGIRAFGKSECEHLLINSFYSVSGAMGELETPLTMIAATRQPVMIIGENGTGKEQIARLLYLRSPLNNKPFVVVDCALMRDKTWDYLLNHYSSPLNDTGCTIYFQNMEALPDARYPELLSVILDTGLTKRQRLLFSCTCMDGEAIPEVGRLFASRLGCLTLRLPTLRSRSDEIPSLASLYLGSLNLELGKQLSGFDAQAIEQLRHYDWPNNYTQFKQVLYELTTLATSSYIRSSSVAELLSKERTLTKGTAHHTAADTAGGRTLEQITYDVIRSTLEANGGNQSAAAKALGISRTTMWRYLNSAEAAKKA
ncbi:MAG: sigma-54-dependent transcriptional regulator [Clostridia bacterium]|nr:sigma-54-dependent transcriptional regulator [Clostridia bacterium]NLS85959.1 sigma 54-interacting transcriptional regulator [Oscillospiraceae bacterium]